MFDRTPQQDHLGPGFSLLRGFGVPVQSPYLLLVCLEFLFLHHSVLIGILSSIDVDIPLPSYFPFCKYLLIYLAVPGLAWDLSSSVWLVGSFSCSMQDFFFVSCGMQDLVPWPGSLESYPLGPPGKSLPLILSYLDTVVVFWHSLCLFFSQPHLLLSSRYC